MTRISLTEDYDDRSVVSKIQKLDGKVDASVIDVTDVKEEVRDKLDELGGEFATQKVALQNDIDSCINQAKAEARTEIARLGSELEGALDGVDERIERRVVSAEENVNTAIARLDEGLARVDDATAKAVVAKVLAEQATQRLADELQQLHSVFHYRGSVNNANVQYLELREGDVWNIADDGYYPKGSNIVCTGSGWDKLSETVDLSGYVTRETYEAQVYPVINAVPQIRETASTAYSTAQQADQSASTAYNAAVRAENLAKKVQTDTSYAVSRVPSLNDQVLEHIRDIEALQTKDTQQDSSISGLDTRVSALEAGGGGGSGGSNELYLEYTGGDSTLATIPHVDNGFKVLVAWRASSPDYACIHITDTGYDAPFVDDEGNAYEEGTIQGESYDAKVIEYVFADGAYFKPIMPPMKVRTEYFKSYGSFSHKGGTYLWYRFNDGTLGYSSLTNFSQNVINGTIPFANIVEIRWSAYSLTGTSFNNAMPEECANRDGVNCLVPCTMVEINGTYTLTVPFCMVQMTTYKRNDGDKLFTQSLWSEGFTFSFSAKVSTSTRIADVNRYRKYEYIPMLP